MTASGSEKSRVPTLLRPAGQGWRLGLGEERLCT
jgi:hypothetical protein